MTVKAALTRDRARQDFGGNPAFPRGSREAPPEKPGRAIPLSWEITDFPTHGEPQTVCRSVAALEFPSEMLLAVGKLLTVRPLPQSQQQCVGTLSLPTLVQCVRLSPQVRKARLS